MKTSFIATVFNEEDSIDDFISSISCQSRLPDEVIIVDGNSTDNTAERIKNYESRIKKSKIVFKLFIKEGNRAVGRNEGIKNATGDIILISDAGCVLDREWVKEIIKPFNPSADGPRVDVVAGYYKGKTDSIFQKCLVPYVLVMPDKVDPQNFLPASRSMAFRKLIWKKVGGFPEEFSHNEDYVFAQRLKKIRAKIVFAKDAIVYWMPCKNLKEAFIMFFRFAKGDSEAKIFRPKVILLFTRYILVIAFLLYSLFLKNNLLLFSFYLLLIVYFLRSIFKNYRYVRDTKAILYLPLMQFTSDIAVILGTLNGLLTKRLKILIEGLFYISIIYLVILLNFRKFRSLFSPPKITEGGIVGYAHYFGYPLYFETIIFFVFLLSPIGVFFILSKFRKHRE